MTAETPLRVRSLKQTCVAAPSQWEGHLEDGRMFYVRFRHGDFEVRVSPSETDDVMEAVRGVTVYKWHSDDAQDGYMDEPTMMSRGTSVLDFSGLRS